MFQLSGSTTYYSRAKRHNAKHHVFFYYMFVTLSILTPQSSAYFENPYTPDAKNRFIHPSIGGSNRGSLGQAICPVTLIFLGMVLLINRILFRGGGDSPNLP